MLNDWNAPLSEDAPTPLWYQIAARLRGAIESGAFAPGEALPSEAQLNAAFGVSRATSRAALNKLEAEDLIIRRSGKGSIVVRRRVDQPVEVMVGFSQDMRRRGLSPSYRVLAIGPLTAPPAVAEALEVVPGTAVFRSYRLLLADGEPIGMAVSWLPPRLFRRQRHPTEDELTTGSLYDWLDKMCGVTVGRAREYIEAAAADDDAARVLAIEAGTPLLVARRQSFDGSDKPTEYVVMSFRSDRYRFHLEVRR